jgi:Peptidase C39 family
MAAGLHRQTPVVAACLAMSVLIVLGPSVLAQGGKDAGLSKPGINWRTPGQDGVNVSVLFAKLNGSSVSYEKVDQSLKKGMGSVTLSHLSAALNSLGCRVMLVRTDPVEIRTLSVPQIVHMDDPYSGGGRFCLVVRWVDHEVELIDGGSVTRSQIPEEVFFRTWSGFAIVPSVEMPIWKRGAIITLTIMLLIVLWKCVL